MAGALQRAGLSALANQAPLQLEDSGLSSNPESCPSRHWNDGSDVCADCGADLQD